MAEGGDDVRMTFAGYFGGWAGEKECTKGETHNADRRAISHKWKEDGQITNAVLSLGLPQKSGHAHLFVCSVTTGRHGEKKAEGRNGGI